MNGRNRKWWLAVVAVGCLAPAAFAQGWGHNPPKPPPPPPCWWNCGNTQPQPKPTQPVPEAGSTAIYLFGAGLTCFGAMFLRSKLAKSTQR
jgi:hypothetical protein